MNAWKACEALRIRRPRRSRSRKRDLAVCPVSGACKQQSGGTAAPTAPCRASSRTAAANITLLWSSRVFSEIGAGRKKARRVFHQRAIFFELCAFSLLFDLFFHLRALFFPVPVFQRDFSRISGAGVVPKTYHMLTRFTNSFARVKPVPVIQYM